MKTPHLYSTAVLNLLQKDWYNVFHMMPCRPDDFKFLNKFFESKINYFQLDNVILSYISEIPEIYGQLQNDNYNYTDGLELIQSLIHKIYDIVLAILRYEYNKLIFYFNYFVLISNDEQLVTNVSYNIRETINQYKEDKYSPGGKRFLKYLKSKIFHLELPDLFSTPSLTIIHNAIALFDHTAESLSEFIDEFKKKEFFLFKVLKDEIKELSARSYKETKFSEIMEMISRNTLIGAFYRMLGIIANYSVFDINIVNPEATKETYIKESTQAIYFFRNRLVKLLLKFIGDNKKSFKVKLMLLIINKLTKRIKNAPERESLFSIIRKIKTDNVVGLAWNFLEICLANIEGIEAIIKSSVENY